VLTQILSKVGYVVGEIYVATVRVGTKGYVVSGILKDRNVHEQQVRSQAVGNRILQGEAWAGLVG